MGQVAPAQDEKKFDPGKKDTYEEKVVVREKAGDKLGPPIENVPMHRKDVKGAVAMWVWTAGTTAKVPKGSELTDKDGVVWVVESTQGAAPSYVCKVAKKPDEKKP